MKFEIKNQHFRKIDGIEDHYIKNTIIQTQKT